MATNYSESKEVVQSALEASALPPGVVTSILDRLDSQVDIVTLNADEGLSAIDSQDLVIFQNGGDVDLSDIRLKDLHGVDAIIFSTNDDVTFTLAGEQTDHYKGHVTTGGGDDSITLNSGRGVTVSTGAGDDSVIAGKGDDKIYLGAGNDVVDSGRGKDTIYTGGGNDNVNTGGGNDTVYLGSGNSTVSTGRGSDLVKVEADYTGNSTVDAGPGGKDVLDLTDVTITGAVQNGDIITITLDNNAVIEVSNFSSFVYDDPSNIEVTGNIQTFLDDFSA